MDLPSAFFIGLRRIELPVLLCPDLQAPICAAVCLVSAFNYASYSRPLIQRIMKIKNRQHVCRRPLICAVRLHKRLFMKSGSNICCLLCELSRPQHAVSSSLIYSPGYCVVHMWCRNISKFISGGQQQTSVFWALVPQTPVPLCLCFKASF